MSTTAGELVTPSNKDASQITTLAGIRYYIVDESRGPYTLHNDKNERVGSVEVRYGRLERA